MIARSYFHSLTFNLSCAELDKKEVERIPHGHYLSSHYDESTVHKSKRSYLWEGSSEWCVCGHHVTNHKQLKYFHTHPKSWVLQILDEEITSDCSGGRNENWNCPCRFFKPCHLRVSTEQPGSSE